MKVKPYFIEVDNLDEYLDVCKHWMYYRQLCGAGEDMRIWYITEYKLKPTDLNRKKIMDKLFGKRPDIIRAMKYCINKVCRSGEVIGSFQGLILTDEDYYWLIKKADGELCQISCTRSIKFLKSWISYEERKPREGQRLFILDRDNIRHRGEIVKKQGYLLFQECGGLCYPLTDIVFWISDNKIKK